MRLIKLIIPFTIILISGCTSSSSGKVIRVDPKKIQDTDANYGSEDLHIFVEKMVGSMLQSPILNKKPKPYLVLGNIKIGVGVDEHIDTVLIKNSIRTNLIKSTKVNFLETKVKTTDYELTGDIHAIKKSTTSAIDNFYALTLILTDIKTSSIVWTEEKEIRKMVKK